MSNLSAQLISCLWLPKLRIMNTHFQLNRPILFTNIPIVKRITQRNGLMVSKEGRKHSPHFQLTGGILLLHWWQWKARPSKTFFALLWKVSQINLRAVQQSQNSTSSSSALSLAKKIKLKTESKQWCPKRLQNSLRLNFFFTYQTTNLILFRWRD